MATYQELRNLFVDSPLKNRTEVAVCVKAQSILDDGAATAGEVAWASEAIQAPQSKADSLLKYVLAKNKSATPAQIQAADDSTLQGHIDSAVDALIAGGN